MRIVVSLNSQKNPRSVTLMTKAVLGRVEVVRVLLAVSHPRSRHLMMKTENRKKKNLLGATVALGADLKAEAQGATMRMTTMRVVVVVGVIKIVIRTV